MMHKVLYAKLNRQARKTARCEKCYYKCELTLLHEPAKFKALRCEAVMLSQSATCLQEGRLISLFLAPAEVGVTNPRSSKGRLKEAQ